MDDSKDLFWRGKSSGKADHDDEQITNRISDAGDVESDDM
jgi:hypothetical protein